MSDVRDPRPLVFVTVGTDHHPFDRLIDWIDAWLAEGGGDRVRCFVQHGTSRSPGFAASSAYVDFKTIEASISEAAVVVCHGGPGTIMLAAHSGKRPVVVPRRRSLGEHVDDHQVVFSNRLAAEETIALAETEPGLRRLLDEYLAGGFETLRLHDEGSVTKAVERVETLVERMLHERPARKRNRALA